MNTPPRPPFGKLVRMDPTPPAGQRLRMDPTLPSTGQLVRVDRTPATARAYNINVESSTGKEDQGENERNLSLRSYLVTISPPTRQHNMNYPPTPIIGHGFDATRHKQHPTKQTKKGEEEKK